MMNPKPTTAEIRAYRNKHECGFFEARAKLWEEWRKKELYKLRLRAGELYTFEALRGLVAELIDFLMEENK